MFIVMSVYSICIMFSSLMVLETVAEYVKPERCFLTEMLAEQRRNI